MKKLFFIAAVITLSSYSKEQMQTMIVVRDCTGIYLQLDEKDYEVCNTIKVASYSYGDTVKVLFNRIERCTLPSLGPVCQMVHPNEGSIEVIEIE